ncbi:MAG: hypothetical protein IBX57_00270 [Gammaproteobacteria bacterium]|nr:hypothetical protein [Gammaproteobacteria bacterium]
MKIMLKVRSNLDRMKNRLACIHLVPVNGKDDVLIGRYISHGLCPNGRLLIDVITEKGHGRGYLKTKGEFDYVEINEFVQKEHFDYSMLEKYHEMPLRLKTVLTYSLIRLKQ